MYIVNSGDGRYWRANDYPRMEFTGEESEAAKMDKMTAVAVSCYLSNAGYPSASIEQVRNRYIRIPTDFGQLCFKSRDPDTREWTFASFVREATLLTLDEARALMIYLGHDTASIHIYDEDNI